MTAEPCLFTTDKSFSRRLSATPPKSRIIPLASRRGFGELERIKDCYRRRLEADQRCREPDSFSDRRVQRCRGGGERRRGAGTGAGAQPARARARHLDAGERRDQGG